MSVTGDLTFLRSRFVSGLVASTLPVSSSIQNVQINSFPLPLHMPASASGHLADVLFGVRMSRFGR